MFVMWISWLKSGGPVAGASDVLHQGSHPFSLYLMLPQSGESTNVAILSGHRPLELRLF